METLVEMYERLGALCRVQERYVTAADLDGLQEVIEAKEKLLHRIAVQQPQTLAAADPALCDRALAAALVAMDAEDDAITALERALDLLREQLQQAGDGRLALRAYRPAAPAQALVDRYW